MAHDHDHYLRKELYDKLKNDESIFDFLQNGSLDGLWYWDLEQPTNEWMNEKFWQTFGIDPATKQHLAAEWQELIFEEDAKSALVLVGQHLNDPGIPYDQIVRYRHQNGSTVWVRCRGMAIRDENGRPIRMLGAHTEVTGLKKIELILSESRANLESILSSISDWVFVLDQDLNFLEFFNKDGFAFGIRDRIAIGANLADIGLPEELLAVLKDAFAKAAQTQGLQQVEFALPQSGQNPKWVSSSIKLLNGKNNAQGHRYLCIVHDITERKEREKENKRLSLVASQTINGVLITDRNGRIEWANAGMMRISGYTIEEMRGKKPGELLQGPQTNPETVKEMSKALRQAQPFNVNIVNYHKDRRPYWVNINCVPLFDDSGALDGFAALETDITDMRQAEDAMRESEEKHRTLFEIMRQGVVYQDANGTIIDANPAAARILGLSLDQMQGRSSIDPRWKAVRADGSDFPGEEHPAMMALKTGRRVQDVIMGVYHPIEDTYRWINIHAIPVFREGEAQAYQVYTTFEDITERTNAMRQLKQKEKILTAVATATEKMLKASNYLEAVADILPVLGEACGVDRVYLFENTLAHPIETSIAHQKVEWNSGVSEPQINNPELSHVPFSDIWPFVVPLIHHQPFQAIVSQITNERLKELLEMQDIKSILVFPLIVKGGFWGFVGFDDCKTARVWLEDEHAILLSFAGSLSATIERLLLQEELEKSLQKAQAASIAKSEFLANMSHEIRTPLNGVIGFTDLLMKTKMDETQMQYMQNVHQSANSLLDLINDVLDFSKIEAGKLELSTEKTDLVELSGQMADMIKFKAHEKQLEVLLNLSHRLPRFVWVDPVRLRQVMVNLLSNAVKFTERGEIELKIDLLEQFPNQEVKLLFSVRDTGIGISESAQQKIFDAFAQEDASTTRKFGGTGLGLSISNRLLALMGTQLQLKSAPGKGSCFYFEVVLRAAEYGGASAQENSMEGIKEVLLLDDNQNNLLILQEMLKTKGVRAESTTNGIEALGRVQAKQFDAMIVDYHMPYMDGLSVIHHIRQNLKKGPKELPILFLHSSSDEDFIHQECLRYEVHAKMVKPVKMYQLFNLLGQLVKGDHALQDTSDANVASKEVEGLGEKPYKVLVVDDNKINIILANKIVSSIIPNVDLVQAVHGRDAVEQFLAHRPDFIFMDVQMPEMSGYDASMEIRRLEGEKGLPRTPIIALTAGTVKGERERCLESGMDDYISKPVNVDTIRMALKQWLLDRASPIN